MTLTELIENLQAFDKEFAGFDVVVPTGLDCAVARTVELVKFNPENGVTRGVRAKTGPTRRIAILISPNDEPRS